MSQLVAFLDRDGTINVDSGYLSDPKAVRLIDGAALAISELRKHRFYIVVVSNQSGIARGLMSREDVECVNKEIKRQLIASNENAIIDAVVYCPHHPNEHCLCRKPQIGLLDNLNNVIDIDFQQSVMIGDKITDVLFGRNIGVPNSNCFLVTGEAGVVEKKTLNCEYDKDDMPNIVESLSEAVGQINKTK